MGWSTSLVSPPDGDLTAFMDSCSKLQSVPAGRYYPGHGDLVLAPLDRLDELITHRRGRETQIREAIAEAELDVPTITRRVYRDLAPGLLAAAERNVFAHLIDLHTRRLVTTEGDLHAASRFKGV
ncbi:MAG: MBL fold metallo-hydrolase, partial [Pseudomonadota bacterium]